DVIRFHIPAASQFVAELKPYAIAAGNIGANVDLEVELIDQNENILGVYNPETALDVSIDRWLMAGTYFLRIRSKGNAYAPDYASLGSYSVSARIIDNNALPLHKLQLKGIADNKQHKLDWEIIADEKIVAQTLEVSANGASFQPVASLQNNERSYRHQPTGNTTYYRLAVKFDNGKLYYSNAIVLRNSGSNSKPYLLGNVVSGSLRISSPAPYAYTIVDLSGRKVSNGRLQQGVNTVPLNFSTPGLYLIQFSNGQETFTEKFNRQ
ncbi:MAG TPA: T9SS type A sorting domain-containing protein, partial [Flavisolibacter sp.]|nr:T9SS type A sorting domain-containing protein [Flavisolibacter sp.]